MHTAAKKPPSCPQHSYQHSTHVTNSFYREIYVVLCVWIVLRLVAGSASQARSINNIHILKC
jgi:hypothetical protein